MPDVNTEIFDRAVRHQSYLMRLTSGEKRRVLEIINTQYIPLMRERVLQLLADIEDKGQSAYRTVRSQHFTSTVREVDELSKAVTVVITKHILPTLQDLVAYETLYTKRMVQHSLPFRVKFSTPNLEALKDDVLKVPMQGQLVKQHLENFRQFTVTEFEKQIRIGIINGDSPVQIRRRITGRIGPSVARKTRRSAQALVQTVYNGAANYGRERFYTANTDVIKKYQYNATLDSRTTIICASLDGQVFKIGEGPVPPQHINCRSTTTPIVEGWEDFGLQAPSPAVRSSMNGEVPAAVSFPQWLRKQSKTTQKKVLGKTRAELFREGKLNFTDMVDETNRPLTLKQLRELDKI